jgi:orotate phosphoribosyltransferase
MENLYSLLWNIKAISVDAEREFVLPNSKTSPFYIDIRKVFGIPHVYQAFVEGLSSLISRSVNLDTVTYIGGDETAGIPLAAWIALRTNKGLIYIRKRQKEYGLRKLIEGADPSGKNVVLVTDLVSTGNSLRPGIEQLLDNGSNILWVFSVIDRHIAQKTNPFSDLGVPYTPLLDLEQLFREGFSLGFVNKRILMKIDEATFDDL